MPDERSRFGRFGQPYQYHRPCLPHRSRPHKNCPGCATGALQQYRVVRRYRGDRVARDLSTSGWCDLWRLQAGDVSWPDSRRG
jgi:hypothetical protein